MPQSRRKFRLPHPQPVDALTYARFTGISTFMRLPHISQPEELDIALIGVPFDGGTTYRPGRVSGLAMSEPNRQLSGPGILFCM